MNIIFLDIDGVVCTLRSHFAFDDGFLMLSWDIIACQMIRKLCEKYNCKIVISSTWRRNESRCKMYLATFALITHLHEDWKTISINKKNSIRGDEINAWLKRHKEIKNYVIIDDDTDFYKKQKSHLIKTSTDDGFSSKNFMEVEKFLL